MVREALIRGHEVSLFNRGRSNKSLFPDLKLYVGDRDGGLGALKGNHWDAVIDNSGYVPRHVEDSAKLLRPLSSHYLFISSISVYASFSIANSESSPLATIDNEHEEEVTGETYGALKALCEKRAAEFTEPEDLTILRPTYICGAGDRSDRFSYWPIRTARGGDMLWPGTRDDKIQIIDVRDLARFTIDCLENKTAGIYNTVTPAGSYSMGDLHDDCVAITGSEMQSVWVDDRFMAKQKLEEGRSLPVWSPPHGETAGLAFVKGDKAAAAGLVNRPVRETARDVLDWWRTLPEDRQSELRAGLSREKEKQLLDQWKSG
jgi:2'-hydroxyisoflavone reductase